MGQDLTLTPPNNVQVLLKEQSSESMRDKSYTCCKKAVNSVLRFKVEKKKSHLDEVITERLMEEVDLKQ